MIYYFVTWDGCIETEDAPKGWFDHVPDSIFTRKIDAIKQAKHNIKLLQVELEERLKEL